jgi:hypothetical protein
MILQSSRITTEASGTPICTLLLLEFVYGSLSNCTEKEKAGGRQLHACVSKMRKKERKSRRPSCDCDRQLCKQALSFSHVLVVMCVCGVGHDEMRTFFMFFWAMTRKSTDEKGLQLGQYHMWNQLYLHQ